MSAFCALPYVVMIIKSRLGIQMCAAAVTPPVDIRESVTHLLTSCFRLLIFRFVSVIEHRAGIFAHRVRSAARCTSRRNAQAEHTFCCFDLVYCLCCVICVDLDDSQADLLLFHVIVPPFTGITFRFRQRCQCS